MYGIWCIWSKIPDTEHAQKGINMNNLNRFANVCFFLLIPCFAFGQYQPVLAIEKTTYNIKMEPFDALIDAKVRVQGDTTINQTTYKKVLLKEEFSDEKIVGHVRESPDHSKLWFLNNLDNQEHLIMDLTLEVGDSFAVLYEYDCLIGVQLAGFVKVVGTTVVENRKTITLGTGNGGGFICDSLKFIEGMGPNATLFFQTSALDYDIYGLAYKVCNMYKEDTLSFPSVLSMDLCTPTGTNEVNKKSISFSIMPNPNNGSFTIKQVCDDLKTSEAVTFQIFDLMGSLVYSTNIARFSEQTIDANHLYPGLYLYNILYSSKVLQFGKVIKN
jgi:hypothetical protein